jgi:hypothetical protein
MFTVYRMYDISNQLLYIGHSESALGRLGEHAEKQPFWPDVCVITLEKYDTYQGMRHAEEMAIQNEVPLHNKIKYDCVAHYDLLPLPTYNEKTISITVPKVRAQTKVEAPKLDKLGRRIPWHRSGEKERIKQRLIEEGRLTVVKPIGA